MLKNLTKHSKWTPLFLAYMVLIHLALIGLFFKTQGSAKATAKFAPEASSTSNTTDTANAPNPHVPNMLQYHGWVNSSAPEGAAIFLGDSITQGLATAAITPYAINFGIGFQTSAQLLSNLPAYSSLAKARVLFLEIGTNDLAMGQSAGLAERYAKIIQTLPPNTPLIWSGVMPAGATKIPSELIRSTNQTIQTLCAQRKNCRYIDTVGILADNNAQIIPELFLDDQLHLSPKGYAAWISALKQASSASIPNQSHGQIVRNN